MELSNQSSPQGSSSHVDLDAIMAVLRDHPDVNTIIECKMAASIYRDPAQRGMYALEKSANVDFDSVRNILSADAWGLSPYGLIQTIERGKPWDSDGREIAIYRLSESVRVPVTKSSLTTKGSNYVQDPGGLDDSKVLEDLESGKGSDRYAHRFSSGAWALLDPALDIWSRVGFRHEEGGKRKDTLGHEGWRIAMLTGMGTVEMSAKEWAELAGGTDKGKRLAKKFLAYGFGILTKTGKARATRYVLDWSVLLSEQAAEMFLMDDRSRWGKAADDYGKKFRDMNRPKTLAEIQVPRGPKLAKALLAELDGTESPEYCSDIHRLAETYRTATAEDWARWMDVERTI